MYVRLAFAVAAHLDPEILHRRRGARVGDEEFQRKCIGKMRDAAAGGRTVVFVSHGLDSVRSLCSRAYLVEDGGIAMEGPADAVVRRYLDEHRPPVRIAETQIATDTPRIGSGAALFRHAAIVGADGQALSEVHLGEPVAIVATVEVFETVPDAILEFGLSTPDGVRIASLHNIDEGRPATMLEPGLHEIRAEVDVTLIPAEYALDVALHHVGRAEPPSTWWSAS